MYSAHCVLGWVVGGGGVFWYPLLVSADSSVTPVFVQLNDVRMDAYTGARPLLLFPH